MTLQTTVYRRISLKKRSVFRVSRILVIMMLIAIIAACIFKVDIVARAPGLIVPTKATRPVTANIDGIVYKFHVVEGQNVNAGDLLVTLREPSIPIEIAQAEKKLNDLGLERLVMFSVLSEAPEGATLAQIRDADIDANEKEKWLTFLTTKYEVPRTALDEFDAIARQTTSQLETLDTSIGNAEQLLELHRRKNDKIQEMVAKGIQNEFNGLDSLIQIRELEERLFLIRAERITKANELETIQAKRVRFLTSNRDKMTTRLVELDKLISLVESKILTLQSQREKLQIRAPIQGVIQEINTSALSLRAGNKTLLSLVPIGNGLQVIARIKNQDIRKITSGQTATLLFDAFPLAIYGTFSAVVETISEDVAGISGTIPIPTEVMDQRVIRIEQEKIQPGLSYITTLRLVEDETSRIQVRPGMSVLANIKTGEQRIISFFLNPLFRAWHSSLKE